MGWKLEEYVNKQSSKPVGLEPDAKTPFGAPITMKMAPFQTPDTVKQAPAQLTRALSEEIQSGRTRT